MDYYFRGWLHQMNPLRGCCVGPCRDLSRKLDVHHHQEDLKDGDCLTKIGRQLKRQGGREVEKEKLIMFKRGTQVVVLRKIPLRGRVGIVGFGPEARPNMDQRAKQLPT